MKINELLQRGIEYFQADQLEEAKKIFKLIIDQQPQHADSNNLLGAVETKLNNFQSAREYVIKAITLNPVNAGYYLNLGNIQKNLNQLDSSLKSYDFAIYIKNDFLDAYVNCTQILIEKNELEKALEKCKQGISKCKRNTHLLYFAIARIYKKLNNRKLSLANYDAAIKLYPEYSEALFDKSLLLLENSEFQEAWNLYEWRWKTPNFPSAKMKTVKPLFKNIESDKHKKLYIWSEQGLGDEILYASMLEDWIGLGIETTVGIDQRMINIYERSISNIKFIDKNTPEADIDFDVQMPMGNLGSYVRNSISQFKLNKNYYILPDKKQSNEIRKILNAKEKLICGITWKSKNIEIGNQKSLSLNDLIPFLKIPNIIFVNLQYGDTKEERTQLYEKYGIEIFNYDQIDNFHDLNGHTSLIDACDVVVSASNSTAHISGALGKETYLMLPNGRGSIWYWSNRLNTKSIWYPSIQIHQQEKTNQWHKVINEIGEIILKKGMQ